MKFFIVFTLCLVPALCRPGNVDVTQDTSGNYKYIIDTPDYKKFEERHPDGTVTGEYSHPDANGVLQTVKYISGPEGFKILDAPLPVAHEFQKNTIENLFQAPLQSVPLVPEFQLSHGLELPSNEFDYTSLFNEVYVPHEVPQQISDTPEVQAAKEAHFAAHAAHLALLNQH